jgi:hypothetical protein
LETKYRKTGRQKGKKSGKGNGKWKEKVYYVHKEGK